MRRLIYVLLAGLLLTVAADGFVNVARERPLLEPSSLSSPTVPPYNLFLPLVLNRYLAGYQPPFGIDMYANNTNSDGEPQMAAAGAGWETVSFYWSQVEPTAPISGVHSYDWSGFDAVAARAQADHMSLFVLFTSNPGWAAALPGGPVTPTYTIDLNNIAAAAAERYDGDGVADANGSPVINYWSFYAEPDNGDLGHAKGGKGFWGNTPNDYADMIAGVSSAIHAANPHAVVMIGGLAYDNFTPTGPFVQSFLDGVLKRLNSTDGGVTKTLGAIAFHYYPINAQRWPTIKEKTAEIRQIMINNGVGNLPVYVPEMGYWSTTVKDIPVLDSSEPQQAQRLVQMFVRGFSVGIKEMSWFAVFDNGTQPSTETHGLFRGTDLNQPKPSYTAYKTLTNELFGATYASAISGGGVEGYVFNMPGNSQKTVLWATSASANYVFHMACVRRVDYMGNITASILDGNPAWDMDHVAGQITLHVLQNQPIYVGGC